jgi:N-methylhydantoinase A
MAFRISVDTGGTFTDVVIADGSGIRAIGKALTTPNRIFDGMRAAIEVAAQEIGLDGKTLLSKSDMLIYGTTRATNAVVTKSTAKTAFLTTRGFRDVLVLKEGGKYDPHDYSYDYPPPYIPRRCTFEIDERVDAQGNVIRALDRNQAREVIRTLAQRKFEAVAVCLLWSIANGDHEKEIARLIEEELPGVPYTLSHELIPIVREYRRASTTAIDASLKPLMQQHLREMESDLRAAGFSGELLIGTSGGGCQHVTEVVGRPVTMLKSGPAMAPVAGKAYTTIEDLGGDAIVCDTGGTTFDVGLVRDGELVYTRDSWLGRRWLGDMVAMSTVDVRSIGAGGGSIAWIDAGGLLRVGPQSAGAMPGPACYGAGGDQPTVTDACVVLGWFDPDYFNGGRMQLDAEAAHRVLDKLAQKLGRSVPETAFAIITIAPATISSSPRPKGCRCISSAPTCRARTCRAITRATFSKAMLISTTIRMAATPIRPTTHFWCRCSSMTSICSRPSPNAIWPTSATAFRRATSPKRWTFTRKARWFFPACAFSATTRTSRTSSACAGRASACPINGTATRSQPLAPPASPNAG